MHNMRLFISGLCLFIFQGLWGQEVSLYSLNEAIDYALINKTEVVNAMADEQIALAKKNEIRGIGLPQVNANFDFRNFVERPTNLLPAEFFGGQPGEFVAVQFGTKYNATASIEASQIIFSGDYIVALQSSGTYIELSKWATAKTKNDVAVEVAKTYYSILVNQQRIQLLNESLEQLEKMKNETKAGHEAGFVEQTDLDRITVSYNNLEAEKQGLEKMLALSYAMLKFQMGMELSAPVALRDSLDESALRQASISANAFSAEDRAEIQLLKTQRQLYIQNVKLNRFGYLPTLVAYGSLSAQAQRNEFNFFSGEKWYPIGIVGLSLQVPIFDGLQKHYRVQQARLEVVKTENSLKEASRGLELEYESAKTSLENSLDILDRRKENIELARRVFDVSGKKFKAGTGSSYELIEAETALMEAQANYYNALYNAMIAWVDYQKATGTLLEDN